MLRSIHRRWLLVGLITVAQATCLLIGEGWFVGRLETRLRADMRASADTDQTPPQTTPTSQEQARAAVERTISAAHTDGLIITLVLTTLVASMSITIVGRYESRLAALNEELERIVDQRGKELVDTREAVIVGLAKLAESRDDDTGQHLDRIRRYVELLAEELSRDCPGLDPETIDTLSLSASLHDIGKVGIPDSILLKPGPLTSKEREIMKRHPLIGGECLMAIRRQLGYDAFLEIACEIAFAHHERWDGTGYPFGLRGEEIPLSARIVALADAYDALTMTRVYKPSKTHQHARDAILCDEGTHFDPRVVRAFVAAEHRFRRVAERYAQPAPPQPDRDEMPALVGSD